MVYIVSNIESKALFHLELSHDLRKESFSGPQRVGVGAKITIVQRNDPQELESSHKEAEYFQKAVRLLEAAIEWVRILSKELSPVVRLRRERQHPGLQRS